MTARRIRNEIKEMQADPPPGCSASPLDSDLYHWIGTIIGPSGTPYEKGIFKLDIVFPDDYPYKPPHVQFLTRVYHPNIRGGGICLDILKDKWAPALTIGKVLLSISSLLNDPNPFDPLDSEIAYQYQYQRQAFNNTARQWTRNFAK